MNTAKKISLIELARMQSAGQPITMLTAYDASFARAIDQAGIDCVLVGDSLGNVIQGRETTLPVMLDDMVYHVRAVRRGLQRALLIADLPYMSYHNRDAAVVSAARLMQAGAQMVKLEGAGGVILDSVQALTELGVPVCGHVGLTPQSLHQLSGYRVQGRSESDRQKLLDQAAALVAAGAVMLVVECVPADLAAEIRSSVEIPVIGIGAGRAVDGQVLVLHDVLGLNAPSAPRFVRDFLQQGGSIAAALTAYRDAVINGTFPSDAESYPD